MAYYVYIMMDENNTRHFIGFTNNLARKVQEHKSDTVTLFAKHGINKLVYYEKHAEHNEARRRETIIKSWEDGYLKNILSISNKFLEDIFPRLMSSISKK